MVLWPSRLLDGLPRMSLTIDPAVQAVVRSHRNCESIGFTWATPLRRRIAISFEYSLERWLLRLILAIKGGGLRSMWLDSIFKARALPTHSAWLPTRPSTSQLTSGNHLEPRYVSTVERSNPRLVRNSREVFFLWPTAAQSILEKFMWIFGKSRRITTFIYTKFPASSMYSVTSGSFRIIFLFR